MKNNIVLCGFMGCGKSTVGKALTDRLSLNFCDSDTVIEQCEGTTISQIFADKGEEYFRALEADTIRELSNQKGLVIATGGGAIMNPENVENLRKTGFLVFLDISPKEVLKRLEGDTTRPLLMHEDKAFAVRELLEKRRPIYSSAAHCTINAEDAPQSIAEKIIELYVKNGSKP